jgi:hypothetical protein
MAQMRSTSPQIIFFEKHVPENITELRIFSEGRRDHHRNHTVARCLLALTSTRKFGKILFCLWRLLPSR